MNTKSHNFSKQRINKTDVLILFEGELITEKDRAINKVGHGEWPPLLCTVNKRIIITIIIIININSQRGKKVMSDNLVLVDFAIGLVNSVFNLPDGQVIFFEQLE